MPEKLTVEGSSPGAGKDFSVEVSVKDYSEYLAFGKLPGDGNHNGMVNHKPRT